MTVLLTCYSALLERCIYQGHKEVQTMRNEIKFNDEAVESKVKEIANLGIGHSTIDGNK